MTMPTPTEPDRARSIRGALYVVLVIASGLAVGYGLVAQEHAEQWVFLAVSVFDLVGLVLARRNLNPPTA